jgi:hypothetical protein
LEFQTFKYGADEPEEKYEEMLFKKCMEILRSQLLYFLMKLGVAGGCVIKLMR